MTILKSFRLLLSILLLTFSSCDKDDDTVYEVKKGYLTAHTWKYERVSYNGSANRINSWPDDRLKFDVDGSYTRTTTVSNGDSFKAEGSWELNKNATHLTFIEGTMRGTAPVRELTAHSLKIIRDDAPDIIIEFDLIPE